MGDRVVAVHVQLGTETEDRAAAADLQRRWQEWRPDEALVLLLGVDEDGRPSRVLGPAIAGYLRELATSSTERVLLLIGEVAPHHWWEQVLFNRRGAVVARDAAVPAAAPAVDHRTGARAGARGDSSCRVGEPGRAVESTL